MLTCDFTHFLPETMDWPNPWKQEDAFRVL